MTVERRVAFEELIRFDSARLNSPGRYLAGVDEAGRGALAGPVVAAAVIVEPVLCLSRVRDSKLVAERERETLHALILERCVASGIGIVGPDEIDRINIHRATLKAMKLAIEALETEPALVLVDGGFLPEIGWLAAAVTGGDRKSFSIAAASIIAKVTRDRIMRENAETFHGYGFGSNKGYGTREHREAIRRLGRTEFHRKSFVLHG